MSKQIITWDWRTDPEAPRTWKRPEDLVVLVDGLISAEHEAQLGRGKHDAETVKALDAIGPMSLSSTCPIVLVHVDMPDAWRWMQDRGAEAGQRIVPALCVERQADLGLDQRRALYGVKAAHRALLVTPREEIDLDPRVCPSCGHSETDGEALFCREHGDELEYGHVLDPCAGANGHGVDLVIVRAPIGPDAWPMHPAWVRAIRDQCKEAGVAFCFAGWGEWLPISEAMPGDEQRATAVADVWQGREGDPDDMPLLSYRVGAAQRAMRYLDGVEHAELPEGL